MFGTYCKSAQISAAMDQSTCCPWSNAHLNAPASLPMSAISTRRNASPTESLAHRRDEMAAFKSKDDK
jgi:hypothetical protein